MLLACHEKKPGECKKKGNGNGVTGKEEKKEIKRRFLDVVKEDMGEVGARKKDIENRTL